MTTDHNPSRSCHLRGCNSPECALASYRYMSGLRLDHSRGIRRLHDAAPVLEHIQRLLANDWLVRQIAEASGVSISAIRYVLYGQPTISRDRARAILNVPIGPAPADKDTVDATGTIRRLRALACLGHTLDSIGAETGMSRHQLGRIITGKFTEVSADTAQTIARVYRHLSTFRSDNPHTIRRARANGWAPPGAWDDIDDPNAAPDWTGHCGTDRGWWLHRFENIPVCPPCTAAHEQWKAERSHLTHSQRWSEIGRARSQARSREADLAHDARELMRVSGLDVHQAAERLGVSRNHLQQAMLRHPEAVAA